MARIKKKKSKSGIRYQVLHYVQTDEGSRENSVGVFPTHAEAKRKKAEVETAGTRRDAKGKTMAMLFDELLAIKRSALAPMSYRAFASSARVLLNTTIQGIPVGEVPVTRFETEQVDRLTVKLGRQRALQTQRTLRSVLKQAFDLAVRWKWIHSNPCHSAVRISSKQPRAAAWTIGEVRAIRAAATMRVKAGGGKWAEVDKAVIEVMVGSGCRRGEVLGLDRRAVDLDAGTITIRQAIIDSYDLETGKKTRPGLSRTPKTDAGYRTIQVPNFVQSVLRERTAHGAKMKILIGGNWNADGLLFVDPETGGRCSPQSFSLRVARLVRRAGVSTTPSPTHGLRHSHAQALLDRGTPTTAITARLGHASEKTTLSSYLRPTPPMDDAASDLAESLFSDRDADNKADKESTQ